jgi:hypothetical protein
LRIFGEWEALSLVPEGFGATRGLEAQANPLDLLNEVDLEDPELAHLAEAIKSEAIPLWCDGGADANCPRLGGGGDSRGATCRSAS